MTTVVEVMAMVEEAMVEEEEVSTLVCVCVNVCV